VKRYVLSQVTGLLRSQNVEFSAADLDYNLLELDVSLRNLAVRSTATPDLPPIARIGSLELDLGLRQLLGGSYRIEDAQLRDVNIHVVVDEKGHDNIPKPPEKEDTGDEIDYLIDQAAASGGPLIYEDRRQQILARLPAWRLTIDGDPVTSAHTVRFDTSQPGSVSFQGRTAPLRELSLNAVLERSGIAVRELRIVSDESRIAVSGEIDDLDDPRFDTRLEADLDLASVARLAGVEEQVAGTLHAEVAANGPLGKLQVQARLEGDDLQVRRFDRLDLEVEAAYDAARQRVEVASLAIQSPSGNVRGNGALALAAAAGQSNVNLQFRSLNLESVSRSLDLPVRIASRAAGRIEAAWPAMQFEQAAGRANLDLTPTRTQPARDVLPVAASLTANARGRNVTLNVRSVDTLGAAGSGTITVSASEALDGQLVAQIDSLGEMVQRLNALLGKGAGESAIGTTIEGPARITARLGGTLDNPRVATSISSTGLQLGKLSGVDADINLDYGSDRIVLRNADVNWRGQSVNVSGTVGLKGDDAPLDLTARIEQASIADVLAGLESNLPAQGSITANARIGGTRGRPEANVSLSGTDLQLYGEPLGTLTLQARLDNQVLTVPSLRLDKPDSGGLAASGTYNLETKAYSVNAAADDFTLSQMVLPDGTPVRGVIDLSAQGSGTIDDPMLDLTLNAGNLRVRDDEIGSVSLTARVAQQQANIEVAAPRYQVSANATVGIRQPYPAQFAVRLNGTDLAQLPIADGQSLTGTVTATVTGNAPLADWKDGQVEARVARLDLRYNGQPVRTEGPLVARYADGRLAVEQAVITAEGSRLSVQGELPLDPAGRPGAVEIHGMFDLASLAQYVPQQGITAAGQLTVDGQVEGTLQRIDPDITLTLASGSFSSPQLTTPVTEANLRLRVNEGTATIETLSASWATARIHGSGDVPLGLLPADLPVAFPRKSGPAELTLDAAGLQLASIPQVPDKLTGTVSLHLEARAPEARPEAITARLTFPELSLNMDGLALAQEGQSTVVLENSVVRVERFRIAGPETQIQLSGTAGLEGKRPLDLQASGRLDAAILSLFSDAVRAQGPVTVEVAVNGTASEPRPTGFLAMAKGVVGVDEPRIAAENLDLRIEMADGRLNLATLTGSLNGGTLSGSGGLRLEGSQIRDVNLALKTAEVYLDYPEDLKTLTNADLKMASQPNGEIVLSGQVLLVEGSFTDDINIDQGLVNVLSSEPELELTRERNPLLERVRFSVDIDSASPLIVDNNLARTAIGLDLRLLGMYYRPGMSGRIVVEEGGELYLNERTYLVDRGVITFTNETKIEPSLDILARTEASGYDITLQVQGDPGNIESTLTSDPPLPEPSIVAVLLTGRTIEEIRGAEVDIAKEQLLSYLTGRFAGGLSRQLEQTLGLSQVRVEPELIAAEENPTARLTVGQDITRQLSLIYSMNLTNSSDQIWIADYDLTKRFSTKAIKQEDNSYRFEFRHDLEMGGVRGDADRLASLQLDRKIGQIQFQGNRVLTDKQLADRLDLKTGNDFDFFKVRKGLDRIRDTYAKRDLLEAEVRMNRETRNSTVDLTVNVQAGDRVLFVYEGWSPPGGVQDQVRQIWRDGVFDLARAEDAIEAIRAKLVEEGYLESKIAYRITRPAEDVKRVLFDIQTGVQYRDVELVFEGATVEHSHLRQLIDNADLETAVHTKPGDVTELLQNYYREEGYLDVKVNPPKYDLNAAARTGRVIIPITEGPRYQVGRVAFKGNREYSSEQLAAEIPLKPGNPYLPRLRQQSVDKLEEVYQARAYNEADFEYSISRDSAAAAIHVAFQITENQQSVVREIVVSGNDRTSENMVRTQVELKPGDLLTFSALTQSRRNLYSTGAFSLVYVEREEMPAAGLKPNQKGMRVAVRVNEIQPFRLQYGGFFDTERGPGGIVDFSNRNSLGSARVVGTRVRYDGRLREARLYFSQPLLRRFPVKTLASLFRVREVFGDIDTGHITNRLGFTVQQESRFWNNYVVNYGYRLERAHTVERTPDPILPFDETVRVAPLTLTVTRETRDDLLDATRGSFTSHAVEYAPSILGSALRFVKYFGQYFHYVPLTEPSEIPWSNARKTRLVYAGALRFGAGTGLGDQDLVLSERFFAGGGTTIRGFQQDFAGPLDALGDPIGGDAMLVVNNEIRFPLFHIVDGAGFIDLGNVFRRVSDISFSEIRRTAGIGIRLRTPYFLLRLDYGMKLDRRPGETAGRLFFSIGQAF
jgi:outer membrane protein assembly complex protein YaeT